MGLSHLSPPVEVKSDEPHRSRNLAVAHEPLPDVFCARIFCAEQCDAEVYADYVRVRPAVCRVESINESVLAINALAKLLAHVFESRERDFRREHQGASCGARHNSAVNRRVARRPAPSHVASRAV